ncbi:MAG: two-component sensor histidine kinase, partial [Burkholderiales bacterium]|nr:two-component sensor histidine kinase [Burkholderiales bacterium]
AAAEAAPADGEAPPDAGVIAQAWSPDGRLLYASGPRVALPFATTPGLSRVRVGGDAWVVYTSVRKSGVVQAAQRVAERESMAAESAGRVLPPLLLMVAVVGGLLVLGLRRGLRPLDEAARSVGARSAQALAPIPSDGLPAEILPMVRAINGLIERLAAALATQRRFVADAAHELRTPIAALRLQLQWLQRSGDEASRAEAVADLEAGIARSQRLVEQLLQVARAEPDASQASLQPLDLAALARAAVARFSLRAQHAGLDLGAEVAGPVPAQGDPQQLAVLLDNLIENALRYTPAGGIVDVGADEFDGRPRLRVRDTGPGIPPAERGRVFDRFFRGADAHALARDGGGSGLGLSIVHAIAERHGARVGLHTGAGGLGLEVRVEFARPDLAPS